MDPLIDPRCLVDLEAVTIDGAEGVCRAPRLGAGRGLGVEALVMMVVALLAVGWFVRERSSLRARRVALVLTLALAAVPGAYALFAVRADRPAMVASGGRRIARLHDAVRAFASENGCAWLRTESCVACVPTAQLALVGLGCGGETTEAPIDLFSDALAASCGEVDGALRCGTVDDDFEIEGGVPMRVDPFATPEGPP
jgi:hypothetical protein